jgi:hypothetical protein
MTRIDRIVGDIYRISTWNPRAGITFNQFLLADERPALIHTGLYGDYDSVRNAVAEVLDPSRSSRTRTRCAAWSTGSTVCSPSGCTRCTAAA